MPGNYTVRVLADDEHGGQSSFQSDVAIRNAEGMSLTGFGKWNGALDDPKNGDFYADVNLTNLSPLLIEVKPALFAVETLIGTHYDCYEFKGRASQNLSADENTSWTVFFDIPYLEEPHVLSYDDRLNLTLLPVNETMISDETVLLTNESVGKLISSDYDQLVFSVDAQQILDTVEPGNILISASGSGFLRKVTSIDRQGDQIVVGTENCSLSDVILNGSLYFHRGLTPSDVVPETQPMLRGSVAQTDTDYDFTVPLSHTFYDDHGVKVEITGELSLGIDLILQADFDWWRGLPYFYFAIETREHFSATLSAAANAVLEKDYTLLTMNLNPIVIWVGWIPVVISPQMDFKVGADLEIHASLTTGITLDYSTATGIKYEDGRWLGVNEISSSMTYSPPSLTLSSFDALAYALAPTFRLMFYGVIGPEIDAKPYLRLHASSLEAPWWSLHAGISCWASMNSKVLDDLLPDFDTTLYEEEWLLAQAEIPNTPSAPRDLVASPGYREVHLSWKAPSDSGTSPISGYRVYRGASSGTGSLVASLGPSVIEYIDGGLSNGQTYYYTVTALNSVGEGDRSGEASATPGLVVHSPIHINNDAELTHQASLEGWAGDGSQGNPYVIEGLDINAQAIGCPIFIGNTTKFFVIRDCRVQNADPESDWTYWGAAIVLFNCIHGSVRDNLCLNGGIVLGRANFNTVAGNDCLGCGIGLAFSDSNLIEWNTCSDSAGTGIVVQGSNNEISNNTCRRNSVIGIAIDSGSHNLIIDNYLSENVICGVDLLAWSSWSIVARNVCISSPNDGIDVSGSSNNSIEDNTCAQNGFAGICLTSLSWVVGSQIVGIYNSTQNQVRSNLCYYNDFYGIALFDGSSRNMLVGNSCPSNEEGIIVTNSSDNQLVRNVCMSCGSGVALLECLRTNLTENWIDNNSVGVYMSDSSDMLFFHNNFTRNVHQAVVYDGTGNSWDAGYPEGGNFWSDYTGVDGNEDGIGDTPYTINAANSDRYPLMLPFNISLDLDVTGRESSTCDICVISTRNSLRLNPLHGDYVPQVWSLNSHPGSSPLALNNVSGPSFQIFTRQVAYPQVDCSFPFTLRPGHENENLTLMWNDESFLFGHISLCGNFPFLLPYLVSVAGITDFSDISR